MIPEDEKPPREPSSAYWRNWYILVIGWLVILAGLFYLFTKAFS